MSELPTSMTVMEIQGSFGLSNLKPAERAVPKPGPGQVLVRMTAASLNFRDLLMVRGLYNPRQPLPLIPFSDGAGEVAALGKGVKRFAVGDKVCPTFFQGWPAGEPSRDKLKTSLGGPADGVLREYAVFAEGGLVRAPAHLSDAEAACLPCAAVTAWNALVTRGGLIGGETVLVQGTGGVSIFALQIAKALGARVIATSSSDEKLARARELGADELINYRATEKWGAEARGLTGGRGVDLVVEVGGANTLEQSLAALRPGGRIAMIGVLSGTASKIDVIPILMQGLRIQGIIVGHRESFEDLNRFVSQVKLRPVIDQVRPWTEAPAALEAMVAGEHLGKIVLRIAEA